MVEISHRIFNRSLKGMRDTDMQDIARMYFDNQRNGITVIGVANRLELSLKRVKTLRKGLELRHCWKFERMEKDHYRLTDIDLEAKETDYCAKEIAVQMHRERDDIFSRAMASMGGD